MRHFKHLFLTTLTVTALVAYEAPIRHQGLRAEDNWPVLTQLLSGNPAFASCPSPVNCGGGGGR